MSRLFVAIAVLGLFFSTVYSNHPVFIRGRLFGTEIAIQEFVDYNFGGATFHDDDTDKSMKVIPDGQKSVMLYTGYDETSKAGFGNYIVRGSIENFPSNFKIKIKFEEATVSQQGTLVLDDTNKNNVHYAATMDDFYIPRKRVQDHRDREPIPDHRDQGSDRPKSRSGKSRPSQQGQTETKYVYLVELRGRIYGTKSVVDTFRKRCMEESCIKGYYDGKTNTEMSMDDVTAKFNNDYERGYETYVVEGKIRRFPENYKITIRMQFEDEGPIFVTQSDQLHAKGLHSVAYAGEMNHIVRQYK
ncbi:hypothetical protein Ddc_17091 [Ditylenchus destructor]|nr:hypothetical protein Ddc_17091 [Ditylenchus destructor]